MRNRIISQDKANKGNLGKATVKNVISKFKEQYLGLKDSDETPLIGFELNGVITSLQMSGALPEGRCFQQDEHRRWTYHI